LILYFVECTECRLGNQVFAGLYLKTFSVCFTFFDFNASCSVLRYFLIFRNNDKELISCTIAEVFRVMLVALLAFMTSSIHWLSWLEEFQACKKIFATNRGSFWHPGLN